MGRLEVRGLCSIFFECVGSGLMFGFINFFGRGGWKVCVINFLFLCRKWFGVFEFLMNDFFFSWGVLVGVGGLRVG